MSVFSIFERFSYLSCSAAYILLIFLANCLASRQGELWGPCFGCCLYCPRHLITHVAHCCLSGWSAWCPRWVAGTLGTGRGHFSFHVLVLGSERMLAVRLTASYRSVPTGCLHSPAPFPSPQSPGLHRAHRSRGGGPAHHPSTPSCRDWTLGDEGPKLSQESEPGIGTEAHYSGATGH